MSIKKEIAEYNHRKSNLDTIIEELSQTGYINGKVIDKEGEDEYHLSLEIKRLESDMMKEDIKNDNFLNKEYKGDYSRKWAEEINHIISNPIYQGITIENFKTIIESSTKNKLIDTIIDDIKETIKVVSLSDDEYWKVVNNQNKLKEMLSNDIYRREFIKRVKRVINIREKYKDKIEIEEKEIVLNDMINDIISSEYEKAQSNLSDGGKKGKKKVKDLLTGKIYDSVTDCANDIKHNITYISKHKNRFINLI